jgi:apolipoprotein N-acyltransferase
MDPRGVESNARTIGGTDSRAINAGSARFELCWLGLAAGSGMLYGLVFPPLSLQPLAWVMLVPLLVGAVRVRPAKAALGGLVFTLATGVSLAWWLPGMLQDFFSISDTSAWLGLVGVSLRGALAYAAFCAWLAWLSARRPVSPFTVAAAFGVTEFARANGWIGVPYGLLGYSQLGTALSQTADLAGPYGLGMLVVLVNAALAGCIAPPLRGRRPLANRLAVAASLVTALAYGEWRLSQSFDEGEPIRIAAIQAGGPSAKPFAGESERESLARYLELSASADAADLIFWPEAAVDFYPNESSAERHALLVSAWSLGADLILGAPHYSFPAGSGDTLYHNSVFLIRDGELGDRYDKRHLIPFAEYDPFGPRLGLGRTRYAAGEVPRPLEARAASVGTFVCGELLIPAVARELSRKGAELLANPSDDGWFGSAAAARTQLEAAAMRAIENRRYLVRIANGGYSAVIDPHGRVRVESGFGGVAVLEAPVFRSHTTTPYQRFGDSPVALAALLAGALSMRRSGANRSRFHWR